MATSYDPPSWAGKPSVGLHLDVLKVKYDPYIFENLFNGQLLLDICIEYCCELANTGAKYVRHGFLIDE